MCFGKTREFDYLYEPSFAILTQNNKRYAVGKTVYFNLRVYDAFLPVNPDNGAHAGSGALPVVPFTGNIEEALNTIYEREPGQMKYNEEGFCNLHYPTSVIIVAERLYAISRFALGAMGKFYRVIHGHKYPEVYFEFAEYTKAMVDHVHGRPFKHFALLNLLNDYSCISRGQIPDSEKMNIVANALYQEIKNQVYTQADIMILTDISNEFEHLSSTPFYALLLTKLAAIPAVEVQKDTRDL